MRASPAWAAAIAEEPPEVLAELQPTKLGGIYINVGIVHYIHVYNFQICSVWDYGVFTNSLFFARKLELLPPITARRLKDLKSERRESHL